MEAQNTAVVQDMYAAFGRGDIATLIGHLAEDIVWVGVYGTGPHVPTSGERRGKVQVQEFFQQVADTVKFSRFEPKDFIASGNTVVTLGHYTATTPVGKEFDGDFAMVFSMRDGKVMRFQEFCDSAGINAAYTADSAMPRTAAAGA
jgi:ketosteroid isomerase-like protein